MLARRLVRAAAAPRRPAVDAVRDGAGHRRDRAIGGHVARWLAGRGAPRVVLACRSGPAAAGAAGWPPSWPARATAVSVVACDTAERAELAGLLARIARPGRR